MMQIRLFIFNFKKRIIKIGILLLCIYGMVYVLNFLYLKEDIWCRILWYNYYNEANNIDNLFLGSSHVYCDINPFLLDELNGENNFSMATGRQRLNGSYYILKEVASKHDISCVFLEVYYAVSTDETGNFYSERQSLNDNWINTDVMRLSVGKMEYMLNMCNKENYLETFLPFIRYKQQIFDGEYIFQNIKTKTDSDYLNYSYQKTYEDGSIRRFDDKGYWYTTSCLNPLSLSFASYQIQKENPMTADAEEYLRKIISYCKNNEIEIILFSSPCYELPVMAIENYDAYVEQVNRIAEEYEVSYYDFNLCREDVLPIQKYEYFFDMGHLNSRGADLFTSLFFEVTMNDKQEYFYDSYQEKLENAKENVYGLSYTTSEEGLICEIAATGKDNLEYKVSFVASTGELLLENDWTENHKFILNKDVKGKCIIEVRNKSNQKIIQNLCVEI